MGKLTKPEAIDLIMIAIPYPNQIKNIDAESEPQAIRFTWRGDRYRLNIYHVSVEKEDGSCLVTTNSCLLMTDLLRAFNH